MEEVEEKKIDGWTESVPDDVFLDINVVINKTLQTIGELVEQDELLSVVEGGLFGVAAGVDSEESVQEALSGEFDTLTIDDQKKNAVLASIKEGVRKIKELEKNKEQEKKVSSEQNILAPSPADVLASLKARMTIPSAIAPAARELPPPPAAPAAPAPQTMPPASIQPTTQAQASTIPTSPATPVPPTTPPPTPQKTPNTPPLNPPVPRKPTMDMYREQI